MPLFEYRCPEHGAFERLLSSSSLRESPELYDSNRCPICDSESPRKMEGNAPGLEFKGTWFSNKGSY
jgi:putative FmdB family regulatory protein